MKQDGKTDGRRDQWIDSQTERVCQMDERMDPMQQREDAKDDSMDITIEKP